MLRIKRIAVAALLLPFLADDGAAQGLGARRFGIGVYGGVSVPTGSHADEAATGWHVGGMVETDLYAAVDLRLDGAFSKFGDKEITDGTSTATLSSEVFIYTLSAELNLGPDSAAYPGDNSVSPWIIAGPGLYRFDREGECVGPTCVGPLTSSSAETHWGVSVGAGGTVPLAGLRTFLEARYHIVFPKSDQQGNRTMLLASAGVKFR